MTAPDPRVAPFAARFGDVAATYERARPCYPDAVLAALAGQAGVGPGARILDLAAGTGKLTRQLADLGAAVVAVEPSTGMRDACAAAVPGVAVLDGTAEAIPAGAGEFDVVTVAQAFHWFRTGPALDEIARVLRSEGWLALVRYDPPTGGWAADMWALRHRLADFDAHSYPGLGWQAVLAADPRFAPAAVTTVETRHTTTAAAELAEAESRSFVHTLDPGRLRAVLDELAAFLATHPDTAGRRELTYERPCTLHLCRLVAPVGDAALLAWGGRHLRPLPWRATRDPWAVLVSEVMAQQTGVDRVVGYYRDFLARYPTPAACAAAPVGNVVRAWRGLGYNRRAVNLHASAAAVVERHGGRLPADLGELLALPGVGPYTARAVLAFAFEQEVGVVDTNVGRVLARREGRRLARAEAQALADRLVPPDRSWDWNQALMELGGTVCRRRRPDCRACPVRPGCAWAAAGLAAPDPADGSAGVGGGQPRFEGSDRQGRGRLVEALCRGPVALAGLADVMGWPDDPARADRVAVGLVADGLAVREGERLRLP